MWPSPKTALIVVGALGTLIYGVLLAIVISTAITTATALAERCAELGPGVHEVDGYTYRCS